MSKAQSLFANRDWRLYWTGSVISATGTATSMVTIPLITFKITNSVPQTALLVSLTAALKLLPWFFSGSLVDRCDRKAIIVAGNAGAAVIYLYFTWRVWAGTISIPDLMIGAVLLEVRSSLTQPALRAVLKSLVAPSTLPKALALNQGRDATTSLVGPPLGGLLYAVAPWFPLLLDALSYVTNAGFMAMVRRPLLPDEDDSSEESGLWRSLTAGLVWLLHHPVLRRTVVASSISNLGAISLLMTVNLLLVSRRTEPVLLGLVDSAMAIASLGGAMAAPRLTARIRPWQLSAATGILFAIAGLAMACRPSYPVMIVSLAVPFLLLPAAITVQDGYQIAVTPDALQGRVSAASMLLTTVISPLGPSLAGLLLEHGGPAAALLTAGVIMVLAEALVVSSRDYRLVGTPESWQPAGSGPADG